MTGSKINTQIGQEWSGLKTTKSCHQTNKNEEENLSLDVQNLRRQSMQQHICQRFDLKFFLHCIGVIFRPQIRDLFSHHEMPSLDSIDINSRK